MTQKEKYKILGELFEDDLQNLYILAPNTGYYLNFDIDGYFTVYDSYGKVKKRYKNIDKATDYLLENN